MGKPETKGFLPAGMSESMHPMSVNICRAYEKGNYKLRLVFPFSVTEQKEKNTTAPTAFFPGKKEQKSIFGECQSVVVLEKISESQKKMRAETAKKQFFYAFCSWFEKKFALNAKVLLEYTSGDREAILRLFEDEHRESSFIDGLSKIRRKAIAAIKEMREYCGEAYYPHDDFEKFLRRTWGE